MSTPKISATILAVLMIGFITMNVSYPPILLHMAQTVVGKLMMIALIIYLFTRKYFIIGILMTLFAIQLFSEATKQYYIPNEKRKLDSMISFNENASTTLEEEIIQNLM